MRLKAQSSLTVKGCVYLCWLLALFMTGVNLTKSLYHDSSNVPKRNPLISETETDVFSYRPETGVFDKFRMFKTHAFSMTGTNWSDLGQRHICLGTQTSVDRLHHLVELLDGWTGQLSLAVFTPDIELDIARKYLALLTSCFPAIQQQVSLHLAEPKEHPGLLHDESLAEVDPKVSCENHKQYLDQLLDYRSKEMMAWRESYAYPQNLLRNMAKKGCQTNYTYIPDIDMVLPKGMDLELEEFLDRQEVAGCDKCAYVVPTYEISTEVASTPQNKTELRSLIQQGQAQAFHITLFDLNQKASNLARWEKIAQDATSMDVAYKIDKYLFFYEPVYIARGEAPLFDERFIGFGMTRNTQAYEMYVAGYEFHVLNNAFSNHWGFQTFKSRPPWRAVQRVVNEQRFSNFAKEVSAHYGRDPYPYRALPFLKKKIR